MQGLNALWLGLEILSCHVRVYSGLVGLFGLTGIITSILHCIVCEKSFDIVAATRPAPLSTVRVCVCV